MSTTIYALCHPETQEVRYIGKTSGRPAVRLMNHLCEGKKRKSYLANWLQSLPVKPRMLPLWIVPNHEAAWAEIRTIAGFRSRGYRLTNITGGGEVGSLGWRASPQQRAERSRRQKGIPCPMTTRLAVSAANRRRIFSEDDRARFRELGRRNAGENSGQSKLTDALVVAIRIRHPAESMAAIAKSLGVSPMTICRAVNRQTWRHVK